MIRHPPFILIEKIIAINNSHKISNKKRSVSEATINASKKVVF